MNRMLARLIQVVVVAGLWRAVRWGIDWWAERGTHSSDPAQRRQNRRKAGEMRRHVGLLRRLTRWMR
ncbi:MAG: hypothetical protein AAGD47_08395 [Pseudomonadota bacterium]